MISIDLSCSFFADIQLDRQFNRLFVIEVFSESTELMQSGVQLDKLDEEFVELQLVRLCHNLVIVEHGYDLHVHSIVESHAVIQYHVTNVLRDTDKFEFLEDNRQGFIHSDDVVQ